MTTMTKKELKKLYSLDKELATTVAKVLGYTIKVKGASAVPAKPAPSAQKLMTDITNMLQKELNTMKIGKDLETWIGQLPDFVE